MALSSLGFFDAQASLKKTPIVYLACGSVYRALAAAVVDYILVHPTMRHEADLASFLKLYEQQHASKAPSKQPTREAIIHQLYQIVQQHEADLSALLNAWAMTMFRLTMYGLQQHPTVYHEFALPPQRRDYPTYWIAKSAPAVTAHLLAWSFEVETSASGRPLYAKMCYKPNHAPLQAMPRSILKERHGYYYAGVKSPKLQAILLASEAQQYDDPVEISKLLPTLYQENQAILEKFQKAYRRLASMVTAGEMTKDTLRQCYIKSLPQQRFHGTQAFFDSIQIQEEGHQAHMIAELIHAIARMISLGEMSEAQVFQQMEVDSAGYHEGIRF